MKRFELSGREFLWGFMGEIFKSLRKYNVFYATITIKNRTEKVTCEGIKKKLCFFSS